MKIICQKNDLLNGLNIASKAVAGKSSMSILECINFDSSNGEIRLTGNNNELGIETVIDGQILEKGSVAINSKLIIDIVRKLDDSAVIIESDVEYKVSIRCENALFNILGMSNENFSFLPTIEKRNPLVISQLTLKDVIRQTAFATTENEASKMMSGECFEIKDDKLTVCALDGHRIAMRNIILSEPYEDTKVIIPSKSLNEVNKIITGDEEDIYIFFSTNHVVFDFDKTTIVSRLIEGNYYETEKMIRYEYETKITINKKRFLDSIDRGSLFIKEGDSKPIIVDVKDNNMQIIVRSAIGSMDDNIEIKSFGNDITIGLNPKFMLDALKVIDDEEVNMYFFNSKAPCYVQDDKKTYMYLVLPVNYNTV